MKTSLDLPDDLYRQVKSKSALEGRTVREVATELFTAWVEGRVAASPLPAEQQAESGSLVSESHRWLEQFRALQDSLAHLPPDALTTQLRDDRR
jgi:hypothetical protein